MNINRKRNAQKHAEYQRQWRQKNPAKVAAIGKKVRERIKSDTQRNQLETERRVVHHSKKNEGWDQKTSRYKRWTDDEIAAIFDVKYSAFKIACSIGRSFRAVEKARQRYWDRAPMNYRRINGQ